MQNDRKKDSKETVRAFLSVITKKYGPKIFWVDEGNEFAGDCKKLGKAEGIKIDSSVSLLSFFSELKAGDIITTGHHMSYQIFSNLHFRPLLKFLFIVFILT